MVNFINASKSSANGTEEASGGCKLLSDLMTRRFSEFQTLRARTAARSVQRQDIAMSPDIDRYAARMRPQVCRLIATT
jgi:hypothetical protein